MKSAKEPIHPYKVYKPTEAAELLQVDKEAIYKAIQNNEIPKKEIGKGYRILGEHLLSFMGSAVYGSNSQQNTQVNNMGVADPKEIK